MHVRPRALLCVAAVLGCVWGLVFFGWLAWPAAAAAEGGEAQRISALVGWLRLHGAFVHRCLEARSCPPYGGRCLGASCDILPGELLISVPPHLQLTAYPSVKGSPCPELERWLLEAKEWHFQEETVLLILRLLKERGRGSASAFHEYLATVPEEYPSILWDEGEQRWCFADTPGQLHVARRFARDRALGQMLRMCNVATTESALRWAKLTVDTRAFSGNLEVPHGATPGRKEWNILVPFADIFNDALRPSAKWSRNSSSGVFQVVATQAIPGGSEVLISYGKKSNEKLLSSYGFIHAGNPSDKVSVYLEDGNSNSAPPSMTLSLGQVDPASLKWELRQLEHLRAQQRRAGGPAAVDRRGVELGALAQLRRRCAAFAGQLGTATAAAGTGPATRWMCTGYRGGLGSLLDACTAFTELATAHLEGRPAPAVVHAPKELAHGLLDAWKEVFSSGN